MIFTEAEHSPLGIVLFILLGLSLCCTVAAFILKKKRLVSYILIGSSFALAMVCFGISFSWTKLALNEEWAWEYQWSIGLFIASYSLLGPGLYFREKRFVSVFAALAFFVLLITAIALAIKAGASQLNNVTELSSFSSSNEHLFRFSN